MGLTRLKPQGRRFDPIRPGAWSRRTGAPEASTTRRERNSAGPRWVRTASEPPGGVPAVVESAGVGSDQRRRRRPQHTHSQLVVHLGQGRAGEVGQLDRLEVGRGHQLSPDGRSSRAAASGMGAGDRLQLGPSPWQRGDPRRGWPTDHPPWQGRLGCRRRSADRRSAKNAAETNNHRAKHTARRLLHAPRGLVGWQYAHAATMARRGG